MAYSDRAVRVYITVAELEALLRLPPGHRLEGVALMPEGSRPGIAITILGEELPRSPGNHAPVIWGWEEYRRAHPEWRGRDVVAAPSDTATAALMPNQGALRSQIVGRVGPRPPEPKIPDSDAETWPRFPGEQQHQDAQRQFRMIEPRPGSVTHAPTDDLDDVHFGGPR